MKPIICTRQIDAPVSLVFSIIGDSRRYADAVPHIVKVEFLGDQQIGTGTRFRETRLMGKREAVAEFEVTEYIENDRLRIVSDAGGTLWDSVFTFEGNESQTQLTLNMDVRPYKIFARLMVPLIRGVVTKGVSADLDCVKAYCESHVNASS